MKKWWVSWYSVGSFTLESPWWNTGCRVGGQVIFCAAVIAPSEEGAKGLIVRAHDDDVDIEWRFCYEKDGDWEPFGERFPRAYWMRWPVE